MYNTNNEKRGIGINKIFTIMDQALAGWKLLFIFIACFCDEIESQGAPPNSRGIIPDCDLGADSVSYIVTNREHTDGVVVTTNSSVIPVIPGLLTIIFVHGFLSGPKISMYANLTQALHDMFDLNVIAVDWSEGACSTGGIQLLSFLSYPVAVGNVREVGQDVAKMIGILVTKYGIIFGNIWLMGHSLGGQVAAFAGKRVQIMGFGRISRLLAFDPAGPGFESNPPSDRIYPTDGVQVQIFHTSRPWGMAIEAGSCDFYFNGGDFQPSCFGRLEELARTCSHSMSVNYFIHTLKDRDCNFVGKPWTRSTAPPTSSCANVRCATPGLAAFDASTRGTYYVDTSRMPASCLQPY